jgi:uncharacterized protein DUF5996
VNSQPGGPGSATVARPSWPVLPLAEWQATRDTLQLWTQIVGKVRLVNEPLANHWWNVTLYVTARGFTTSLMPHPAGPSFQIDFDFRRHQLDIVTSAGTARSVALAARPVADFYAEVTQGLDELGVGTEIWPVPVEIEGAIPFTGDRVHASYDGAQAQRFWLALVEIERIFKVFRGRFVGKASPVHLFWGGLDLAVTRFSGRPAPPHHGRPPHCGPQVMLEAYSHEVSSAGYWPGGEGQGLFYSYSYPNQTDTGNPRSVRRRRSTIRSWASSCCPTRRRRPGKIRDRSCSSSCKAPTRRPPTAHRGTARRWSARLSRRGRGSPDSSSRPAGRREEPP